MSTYNTVLQAEGVSVNWAANGPAIPASLGLGAYTHRIQFEGSFSFSGSHDLRVEFDSTLDFAPSPDKVYRITLEEVTE